MISHKCHQAYWLSAGSSAAAYQLLRRIFETTSPNLLLLFIIFVSAGFFGIFPGHPGDCARSCCGYYIWLPAIAVLQLGQVTEIIAGKFLNTTDVISEQGLGMATHFSFLHTQLAFVLIAETEYWYSRLCYLPLTP